MACSMRYQYSYLKLYRAVALIELGYAENATAEFKRSYANIQPPFDVWTGIYTIYRKINRKKLQLVAQLTLLLALVDFYK
jgi:hypothetical protein